MMVQPLMSQCSASVRQSRQGQRSDLCVMCYVMLPVFQHLHRVHIPRSFCLGAASWKSSADSMSRIQTLASLTRCTYRRLWATATPLGAPAGSCTHVSKNERHLQHTTHPNTSRAAYWAASLRSSGCPGETESSGVVVATRASVHCTVRATRT